MRGSLRVKLRGPSRRKGSNGSSEMFDTTGVKKTIAEVLSRPSLGDLVYERLLNGILSGELPSGSTINVRSLAKELGVSRIPIRDALLRLVAEGLVNNSDSRIATVARFTQKEAADVFQLREALECASARLAAERITAEQLAELRDIVNQLVEFVNDGDRKADAFDLDNRLHSLIAKAAGNDALGKEVVRFNQRVWVVQLVRMDPAVELKARDEHLAIIEALAAHNGDAVAEAMRRHVHGSLARLIEHGNDRSEAPAESAQASI